MKRSTRSRPPSLVKSVNVTFTKRSMNHHLMKMKALSKLKETREELLVREEAAEAEEVVSPEQRKVSESPEFLSKEFPKLPLRISRDKHQLQVSSHLSQTQPQREKKSQRPVEIRQTPTSRDGLVSTCDTFS